ncbi:interferon gamma [Bombina bombina]|uniref:interferon gamma n=1 Tax=Bombina bombina TaxID=8345 RepID=UPI00235B280D|nr:interferon gamma [Bombina bombina]
MAAKKKLCLRKKSLNWSSVIPAKLPASLYRKCANNINREETYGGPIFLRYLESWKEAGEKKIILSQIVPMYLKMFESLKITELNNSIDNIKEVLHYTNNNFLKQSDQKLKELNELKKIQMTDSKIRHKALKELFQVLQEIRCVKNPTSCAKSIKRKRNNQRKRRGSQS